MKILVTGGAGYIGSHTCVELLGAGHDVVVVDNLANSSARAIERVEQIAGRKLDFRQVDLCDREALAQVFREFEVDSVIHFAGRKAVGESVEKPMLYYANNVVGTLNLIDCMEEHDVRSLVFSSSATVYGDPPTVPITEDSPLSATNPYGRSKLMVEQILLDLARSDPRWHFVVLRYFNPVGAHASGLIGEDPNGVPNNLLPYVAQVAVGRLPKLRVFGGDWNTIDGSGVRDYIHVVDLAIGHLRALEGIDRHPGVRVYNLGTGRGSSVHEVRKAFERACGQKIPFEVTGRRPGDIACCYADPGLAERELGWRAERDLDAMCRDCWRWQSQNPNGFDV
jgi:UDP-glucose 4-epimerase